MPTTKKTGLNGTAFTLGGSAMIGDLNDCTVKWDLQYKEGKGIADPDSAEEFVGRALLIDGSLMVSGSVTLSGTANSGTPRIAFSVASGAGTYAGTANITNLSHKMSRDDLQTYDVSLKSYGPVSFT